MLVVSELFLIIHNLCVSQAKIENSQQIANTFAA